MRRENPSRVIDKKLKFLQCRQDIVTKEDEGFIRFLWGYMADRLLVHTIKHNCDISDARDNGIYSICALVLKLRNLYKWEHNIEPWQEPETPDLLDWIEKKENYWETIAENPFLPLGINGKEEDPFELSRINDQVCNDGLFYGAGYGRSLKSIFFLAEITNKKEVDGCPVIILGRETARELSSPFAMVQDGTILIRRDPLRYFFWDQIQEIRSSSKPSVYHALNSYGILTDAQLDQKLFRQRLDIIVDEEIPMFIYHEIGELRQKTLDSGTLKKIISIFPDSAIEYVARAVKDVLADTHPDGMLDFITKEKRDGSLGFYVGFLAGLRKMLSQKIINAFDCYLQDGDWDKIEMARITCRDNALQLADKICGLADRIGRDDAEQIKLGFYEEILTPLGLDIPESEGSP